MVQDPTGLAAEWGDWPKDEDGFLEVHWFNDGALGVRPNYMVGGWTFVKDVGCAVEIDTALVDKRDLEQMLEFINRKGEGGQDKDTRA